MTGSEEEKMGTERHTEKENHEEPQELLHVMVGAELGPDDKPSTTRDCQQKQKLEEAGKILPQPSGRGRPHISEL
jgi:hypothetical protein